MNCIDFRRQLDSEPFCQDADFVTHKASCSGCSAAARDALQFNSNLNNALLITTPHGLIERVLLAQTTHARQPRRFWQQAPFRIAAAAMLAVGCWGLWWKAGIAQTLEQQAAAHIAHEPYALNAHDVVPSQLLSQAFQKRTGFAFSLDPGVVNFFAWCPVGQYHAMHMVVQSEHGPVTILYVLGAQTSQPEISVVENYHVRSSTVREGALVLLAESERSFDDIETRWRNAINPASDAAIGQH